MAYTSLKKLWVSEFDIIVSKKDKILDIIMDQLKL